MGQARVTLTPEDAALLRFEVARLRTDGGGALDAHLLALVRHVLKHETLASSPRARAVDTASLVLETDALRVRLQLKSPRRVLVLEWSAVLSPAAKRVKV